MGSKLHLFVCMQVCIGSKLHLFVCMQVCMGLNCICLYACELVMWFVVLCWFCSQIEEEMNKKNKRIRELKKEAEELREENKVCNEWLFMALVCCMGYDIHTHTLTHTLFSSLAAPEGKEQSSAQAEGEDQSSAGRWWWPWLHCCQLMAILAVTQLSLAVHDLFVCDTCYTVLLMSCVEVCSLFPSSLPCDGIHKNKPKH